MGKRKVTSASKENDESRSDSNSTIERVKAFQSSIASPSSSSLEGWNPDWYANIFSGLDRLTYWKEGRACNHVSRVMISFTKSYTGGR